MHLLNTLPHLLLKNLLAVSYFSAMPALPMIHVLTVQVFWLAKVLDLMPWLAFSLVIYRAYRVVLDSFLGL